MREAGKPRQQGNVRQRKGRVSDVVVRLLKRELLDQHARTSMEHLDTLIIRTAENSYHLMSASSSAGSFLHAVETSIKNVSNDKASPNHDTPLGANFRQGVTYQGL